MTVLSTDDVRPARRVAYWRDVVCDVFVALDCRSPLGERFNGRMISADLGDLNVTRVEADAQTVARTPKLIARASDDVMLVSLEQQGSGRVVQDGRDALLWPGDFALYDTTRPYKLLFGGSFTQTVFKIPRAALRRRVAAPEAMVATAVTGATPLGRIARDFLAGFAALPASTPQAIQDRLATQAVDLIALALCERARNPKRGESPHRTLLLVRMRAFIEQNLHRPDLDATRIAGAFRLSPRYVREIWAAEGTTPGRAIQSRRLARCREALCDPAQRERAIGDIAYAHGFADPAHFSRSYRAMFGESARETRAPKFGAAA